MGWITKFTHNRATWISINKSLFELVYWSSLTKRVKFEFNTTRLMNSWAISFVIRALHEWMTKSHLKQFSTFASFFFWVGVTKQWDKNWKPLVLLEYDLIVEWYISRSKVSTSNFTKIARCQYVTPDFSNVIYLLCQICRLA